jgi:hypothetical protein
MGIARCAMQCGTLILQRGSSCAGVNEPMAKKTARKTAKKATKKGKKGKKK